MGSASGGAFSMEHWLSVEGDQIGVSPFFPLSITLTNTILLVSPKPIYPSLLASSLLFYELGKSRSRQLACRADRIETTRVVLR